MPLEQIIEENQPRLGKPVVGNLWDLCQEKLKQYENPANQKLIKFLSEKIIERITDYLFSNDRELIVSSEESIRTLFKRSYGETGILQFTVVYHSPECRRDIFVTSRTMKNYFYIGSIDLTGK